MPRRLREISYATHILESSQRPVLAAVPPRRRPIQCRVRLWPRQRTSRRQKAYKGRLSGANAVT